MADEYVIISRQEAKALGLKRYFTGMPCCRGHIAERNIAGKRCITCANAKGAALRLADPDKFRAATRASMTKLRSADPESARRKLRDWYWSNPDRSREAARVYYELYKDRKVAAKRLERERNPDAYRLSGLKYYRANKDKHRSWDRNRKARKRCATGSHTADELAAIILAQKYRCIYCRADLREAKPHVDHIIPLALGGSNDKTNLQYLCETCNLSKGAKDPIEFAQGLGRLL